MPTFKTIVEQTANAIGQQQNLENITLYIAKWNVARYELNVYLWGQVIMSLPKCTNLKDLQDASNDASTQLSHAEADLRGAKKARDGEQPQNVE